MSDSLKTRFRWLGTGCFLALVYFTAPNCALQTQGLGCDKPEGCEGGKPPDCPPDQAECNPKPCEGPDCPPDPCDTPDCNMPPDPKLVFVPGDNPTDAIMCDFPNAEKPMVSACATQAEVDSNTYLSQSTGATSLASSQHNPLTLDWSAAAMTECGGLPKKVEFLGGAFPDGAAVCINATTQFPNVYANPTKACIAKCEDVIANGFGPYPADVHDYCVNNARTSTNFDKDNWYPNACSGGGTPLPGFVDPRRTPEAVIWTDAINATANGNSVTQTVPTAGFEAGAASAQLITRGDAWVDFDLPATGFRAALALRSSCGDVTACPDIDASIDNIGFALFFAGDGQVYVHETSPAVIDPGPFGPFSANERYRVKATDLHDGTARISYARIVGACPTGTACTEDQFYTSTATVPYPLRVDASFRDQGATLANVNIVRIKE
jgi:hypothetical protein